MELLQKKGKKVKKWSNAYAEGEAEESHLTISKRIEHPAP
jgi:hypothetical protein